MISNSLLTKPTVFVGRYLEVLDSLLKEHIHLLKPKIIWVEYRAIPVLHIVQILRNHKLSDQCYFLEITDLESLDQLLKSRVLLTIFQWGFSTLIVNIPPYYSIPPDLHIRFQELMKKTIVILIMDDLKLPQTQVNIIQVESMK
ncbi:MAG: hypothetical protein ACFFC6_16390 [Promethearchaeota archaeon]